MSSPSQRGALPKSGGGVTVPDGGGPLCRGKGEKKRADPGSLCRNRLSLHLRG